MNLPLNTLIPDLPIGKYHALQRLSSSGIGDLLKTPAHYKAKHWGDPSREMRIGSAVHLMTLEPDLVPTMLPIAPEVNKRTKAGKSDWAAWEAGLHRDAVRLNAAEREIATRAAIGLATHKGLQDTGLLRGLKEQSILFDIDGCPARCRPDAITESGFLVDVKTCRDAAKFDRSIIDFGYHRQAAMYAMGAQAAGIDAKAFIFVVVETSDEMVRSSDPSQFVRIVTLDDPSLLQGERDVFKSAKIYKECTESGVWPGYPSTIETIGLPIWALDIED